MQKRTDIPDNYVPGSSRCAVAVEWIGRLAAVIAIVLLILVLFAIHKGLAVQNSARQIVQDFHTTNTFFAQRADLTAADRTRQQLQRLSGVLNDLDNSTKVDVDTLSATLPDVQRLVDAGKADKNIAQQLTDVGRTLQNSSSDIRSIAMDANSSVSNVDNQLQQSSSLVGQLNKELAAIENKVSVLPQTGGSH